MTQRVSTVFVSSVESQLIITVKIQKCRSVGLVAKKVI